MRHLSRSLLVFVVLPVCGCVTTGNYKARMETWLGGDVNNAIMSFGPPSNTYTMPNRNTMYTWLRVGGTLITTNYNQYLNMDVDSKPDAPHAEIRSR